MKNGTSHAVLVRDLAACDGPYLPIADDFVAQRCTGCRIAVDDDVRFHAEGYLCPPCWTGAVAFSES